MNSREIEERKKYMALQAFYLEVKELVGELEKKLNLELKKSTE